MTKTRDRPQAARKIQNRRTGSFKEDTSSKHLHADHASLCILNECPDNTQDGVNVDKIWIRGDNIAAK